MKNYSRQREAILNVLRSTDTHPTANWIYNEVRKTLPNISLGTVYRNLSALSEAGEIITVNVGDGFDHFDGDISPHLHLHCRNCNSLIDARLNSNPILAAANEQGFTPEASVYVVYGICEKCKQKTN
ncbi:MAG: transcriptional repressor [Ruminococcaceae bacterium]|nr:transcriptional repressor [Oscillospiraceae bacterium]